MSERDDETIHTDLDAIEPGRSGLAERAYLIVLAGATVGEMFKLPSGEAVIGRGKRSAVALFDDGVSRDHARIFTTEDGVWVEDLGSRNGTFLNGVKVSGRIKLGDGDKIQVGRTTILKFTSPDSLEESFQKQMYESAVRDGLTKVFNKRYLGERLIGEVRFATRHNTQLAVLMVDVDHFKRINDTRGHLTGDWVLAAVAQALQRSVRNEDVVARYGGEEFAVVLRATPPDHVRATAERLRKTIESLEIQSEGGEPVRVTVSIGVATYPETPVQAPTDLVEAADQALYRAKNGGRNRVSL